MTAVNPSAADMAKKAASDAAKEAEELKEITTLFVEESRDLISDLDQLLLKLEKVPLDEIVVDLLFRKVHSVKGGAGAVPAGESLATLAHYFESVLAIVKREKWQPPAEALDIFLEAADLCRIHLDHIASGIAPETSTTERTAAAIANLDAIKVAKESGSALTLTKSAVSSPVPVPVPMPMPMPMPMAAAISATTPATPPTTRNLAVVPPTETHVEDADDGIFVASDKLDSFMKLSGEMVVLKNTLATTLRDNDSRANAEKLDKKLNDFLQALNKVTDSLQEQIMSVRKVSLERALSKLPRLVRQTAKDVEKKIDYQTQGFQLGVDKTIAKALSASLTHMVRNSIDHGIETPAKRVAAGKNPEGRLTISVNEAQGFIHVVIEDDGAGIDRERVVRKALEKGLIDETRSKALSDSEAFELIFLPGFSTAEVVSAVSGRGVGMDVVRSSILALDGRISIESKFGHGSKFKLDIPIPKTVMVEQTVVVQSKGTLIAIPLQSISRIIPRNELSLLQLQGSLTFQYENHTVRLIDHRCLAPLRTRAEMETIIDEMVAQVGAPGSGSVIVLRDKNRNVGLIVDAIHDQLEAVVRPFDSVIQQIPGFRGTTTIGDDQIAYVVSTPEVISISLGISEEAA